MSGTCSLPAERPKLRRQLGITKAHDTERRLEALWNYYLQPLFDCDWKDTKDTCPPPTLCIIEGIGRGAGGRAGNPVSAMAAGVIRAVFYSRHIKVVSLNPFELRRRLGVSGRASKDDMFSSLGAAVELGSEHERDAYCLAEAGHRILEET